MWPIAFIHLYFHEPQKNEIYFLNTLLTCFTVIIMSPVLFHFLNTLLTCFTVIIMSPVLFQIQIPLHPVCWIRIFKFGGTCMFISCYQREIIFEPRHDKTNKMGVHPAKTQISLGICPVWLESSLSAWRKPGPKLPIECTVKTLIRLGRCPGWSESSLGSHSFWLFCYVVAHISRFDIHWWQDGTSHNFR